MVGRIQKVAEVQVNGLPGHLRAGLSQLVLRMVGPKSESDWIWGTSFFFGQRQ